MPATAETLRDLHRLHQRARPCATDRSRTEDASPHDRLRWRLARPTSRPPARAPGRQDAHQEARALAPGPSDQDRRPEGQAQPGQEERRVQGPPEPDRPRRVRQREARGRDPPGARDDRSADRRSPSLEAEVKAFAAEVAALQRRSRRRPVAQKAQLQELETAIIEAETAIPEEHREQYRRTVKRHGADALAFIESDACSGCYTSITAQMTNELINGAVLCFCITCGRLLYLAEEDIPNTRRTVR